MLTSWAPPDTTNRRRERDAATPSSAVDQVVSQGRGAVRAPHPVADGAQEVTALRAQVQRRARETSTIHHLAPTPLARSPETRSPTGRGLQGGTCPLRTRLAVHSTHLTGGQHGGTTTKAEVGRSNRLGGTVFVGGHFWWPRSFPPPAGSAPRWQAAAPRAPPVRPCRPACWSLPPSRSLPGSRPHDGWRRWRRDFVGRRQWGGRRVARERGCCAARYSMGRTWPWLGGARLLRSALRDVPHEQ